MQAIKFTTNLFSLTGSLLKQLLLELTNFLSCLFTMTILTLHAINIEHLIRMLKSIIQNENLFNTYGEKTNK